jgi:transcriptional regulator with XRE-family HTH domain
MALSALSFAQKVTNDPARLPPSRSQSLTKYDPRVAHACRPFAADKHGDERQQMSLPKPTRTFRERFSDALRRRLAPNTNLTVSQLAGAIGVSDNTIKNLLSKANEPSARVIDECVALFKDTFLNEIYGCHHIHVIDPRATQKAARIAELHEELRRLA